MSSLKVQAQFLLSEDMSNKSEPTGGYKKLNKTKTGRCAPNQIRIVDIRINKILFNIFNLQNPSQRMLRPCCYTLCIDGDQQDFYC